MSGGNDMGGTRQAFAKLASCRYRLAVGRCGLYACRHPAVRARDGLVTDRTCSGCELRTTVAQPRPFTANDLLSAYEAAADLRNAAEALRPRNAAQGVAWNATEGVPYRPHRGAGDGRVRVGFVTPNLVLGGAERWIVNLLRYLDRERVVPAGVALLNAAPADARMCAEAAEFAPLFGGPDGTRPHPSPLPDGEGEKDPHTGPLREGEADGVIRFESAEAALEALCQRSDVIVAWGSGHFARLMAARRFSGEVVIVAHGSAPSTARMLDGGKYAAQHLVGVSKAAAAAFRDSRAVVIHNGADHARCAPTVPRDETRRQWGAAQADLLLGYVGRFSWEKNPLAAALAARELGGRFRAVYVGGGAHENEVEAEVCAIAPNSIFVPPVEQIGDALAALDVFVLASPSEGFSLALTEAWLCGVPAVATRVGAVPELEELHGQMVVGVRVGASPGELAVAVRRALGPEGQAVAERAKRVAWQHYTAQAMAERWSEFLVKVGRAMRDEAH